MKKLVYSLVAKNRVILANAGSIAGTTAITSGLGFIYWWIAARQFPAAEVGFASAAISAMTLLGTVGMLGLGTLLIGELPRQPEKRGAFISTALLVAALVGLVLGSGFALIGPYLTAELKPLAESAGSIVLFGVGVSFTAVTLVLDQALIGLLRGGLQLWRNGVFAAAKLGFLMVVSFWLADKLGLSIYITWLLGNVVSLAFLVGFAAWKKVNIRSFRPQWILIRGLGRTALGHHALNLALQAPTMAMPVLVTVLLSATATAHFYVAWMVAGLVFVAPLALTTVLYAVGSANPAALAHKMQFTMKLAATLGLAANVALFVSADFILSLFGRSYADEASWCLRILGLGVFAIIIKDHYVAIYRIHAQIVGAAARVALAGVFEMGMAATGAILGGLVGLSLGWLAAVFIEAALMARTVYKAANRVQPPTPVLTMSDISWASPETAAVGMSFDD